VNARLVLVHHNAMSPSGWEVGLTEATASEDEIEPAVERLTGHDGLGAGEQPGARVWIGHHREHRQGTAGIRLKTDDCPAAATAADRPDKPRDANGPTRIQNICGLPAYLVFTHQFTNGNGWLNAGSHGRTGSTREGKRESTRLSRASRSLRPVRNADRSSVTEDLTGRGVLVTGRGGHKRSLLTCSEQMCHSSMPSCLRWQPPFTAYRSPLTDTTR